MAVTRRFSFSCTERPVSRATRPLPDRSLLLFFDRPSVERRLELCSPEVERSVDFVVCLSRSAIGASSRSRSFEAGFQILGGSIEVGRMCVHPLHEILVRT